MAIRKGNDNGRPILGMGPVLRGVRAEPVTNEGIQEVQAQTPEGDETRSDGADDAYNRGEEGEALSFAGKLSGRRKLRDIDVIRLRRNEEQLSYNQWAAIYRVAMAVIWNAVKGYTYKHLNWRYPPLR